MDLSGDQVVRAAFRTLGGEGDIPDGARAREELRVLGAALHAAANAIVITDRRGRILWVNPAVTHITGYSAEEAIGRNPGELVRSGQHDDAFYRQLWDTILAGYVWRGRMINRRKDGRLYTEEQTITPVRAANGEITHFIAVKEDVTVRIAAESALRRSEERYRALFDGVPIGLFQIAPDGRFLDANDALIRILGCRDRAELLGRTAEDFYADRPSRLRMVRALAAEGEAHGVDMRLRRMDGERIWARLSVAADLGPDGTLRRYEGAVEDVTERRETEDRMGFQAQLLDAVGDAVIATDLSGRVVYWNHRAELLFGWFAAEAAGSELARLVVPGSIRAHAADMLRQVCEGGSWSGEGQGLRRDGSTVPILVTATPRRDEDSRVVGVVTVVRDLSDRRALEQELLRAQKMEAVGRLAGGIAHDFNNVLTAVRGHAEFLMDALPAGGLRDDAGLILRSAERASRLTRQLLALGRQQVFQPRAIDLGHEVREFQKLVRPLIGDHITLAVHADVPTARVEADPGQIELVLLNLALNARDAMPHGGTLSLTVRALDMEAADHPAVHPVGPGSYVLLEVADTGTGMDDAVLARLFEPFFTTKPPGKGTGLGLSAVYAIVQQSGGYIGVSSEPGRGATFRIYLPRVHRNLEAAASDQYPWGETGRGETGRGETVLLVEDDDGVRALAARVLGRTGYNVVEAAGPVRALEIVASAAHPEIRLLLTDIVMPEMSGVELARRVLEIRPDVAIVFTSGYTEDEALRAGIMDRRHRFLAKPFTPADLARVVADALDSAPAPAPEAGALPGA